VETIGWRNIQDAGIRIVESNEDVLLYDTGHIPGAVHIDWRADLQDNVIRDTSSRKNSPSCAAAMGSRRRRCDFLRRQGELWACYALGRSGCLDMRR